MANNKGHIFVVDNFRQNLQLYVDILSQEGYRVQSAISGEAALEAVALDLPDLIFLDIEMPGMKGYEVCERLKANPETAEVPIIFISALGEAIDKAKAFSVGGVDYITKPFQIEEVLVRLETHLSLRNLQKNLQVNNAALRKEIDLRKKTEEKLAWLAVSDSLTKLYNRRYFFEEAEKEKERAINEEKPLALILFDIDHFKKVNDTFGHLVGDKVLEEVGKMLNENLRSSSIVARYGGEEFVLLLPDTQVHEAKIIADRLREYVGNKDIINGVHNVNITISLGVAGLRQGAKSEFMDLIGRADTAMYQAKTNGRNQVQVWEEYN
ncbi:MAG: diguanylate cyclase [Chloroflexota bacterium]